MKTIGCLSDYATVNSASFTEGMNKANLAIRRYEEMRLGLWQGLYGSGTSIPNGLVFIPRQPKRIDILKLAVRDVKFNGRP